METIQIIYYTSLPRRCYVFRKQPNIFRYKLSNKYLMTFLNKNIYENFDGTKKLEIC